MASSLGELFIELGVFADTKELKEFENKLKKVNDTMGKSKNKTKDITKSIKGFIKGLTGVVTALSAAYYVLNKLTDSLVSSNQEFLNLTRNSDIALGTFQKWNDVGRMFGVKNAAQQLAGLNQRLYELKLTGQGAEGFMLAGINPLGTDAEGVMEQLRNRVAGLDDTSATFLLNKMGLDPSMLHLLRMTREEFENFNNAVRKFQLTEEQRKQIQTLNIQLEIARIKLQYLRDRAILTIMPYFVKLVQNLAKIVELFVLWIDAVDKLLKSLPYLKESLIALSAVLFAIFKPIYFIFEALYLIIDDVMAFCNGGRSGIGYLLYFFEELSNKLASIEMPKWLQSLGTIFESLSKFAYNINPFTWGMPDYDTISGLLLGNRGATTNNDNRQVVMNNTINTPQTAQAVSNDLAYIQNFVFT